MTKLHIEENVAKDFFDEAQRKRDKFKQKLTTALKEYSKAWYHKERVDYQKKNPKWTHERIEDVNALNKIINESSTTTDLAEKIIDYIDGDNDHFWFAWFSPLRGYMRDVVESFTDKHDTKTIDHDLKLFSDKLQDKSSSSAQRKNSDSLSDSITDDDSQTEDKTEFQERIDEFTKQLKAVTKQLRKKNSELENKASELAELKKLIETNKDPQIQQLTQELTEARKQFEQKAGELQTKTQELTDLKKQSGSQKDTQLQALAQELETAKQQLEQKARDLQTKTKELSDSKEQHQTEKDAYTLELTTAKQRMKQKLEELKAKRAEPIQPETIKVAAPKQAPPVKRALPPGPPKSPATSSSTSALAAVASTQVPVVVTHNENDLIMLKQTLAETQGKLDSAEREKHVLLEKAKEFEAKIKAAEETSAKLNTSEQEKHALVEQVAQLTAQTQELPGLRGAYTASELQIKSLEDQLSTLRTSTDQSGLLEQTQAKIRTLEEEKQAHAKRAQDLESQLVDQQELNQVLTAASKEFDNTLEQKAKQLEEQIGVLQQSRNELTQTKDLLSSALKEQGALQEKLEQSNAENKKLIEANQTLKKENLTQGEKINAQSKKIQSLQTIITELKEKFTQFQSIANNVVDSLSTMFQSAAMYFRKAIVDKKVTAKPAAKSKTSPESSTQGVIKDEKRKSGLGFGKNKGAKDSSSEEAKAEKGTKKIGTFFGSLGKKGGEVAAVAKENIVVNLADLDGKPLRDAARKQIGAKQGDAYNLTVDSIVPGTSKTAEEIVGEFFTSDNALATAFNLADQLIATASNEIVYDDSVDRTLERDIELEKDLLHAKSENDSLRRQIAEQLTLISKSKEVATQHLIPSNLIVEIEAKADLPPPPPVRVENDEDDAPPLPPEFDEAISQSTLKEVERIRQLEQELATEKEQTTLLRAELDTVKSKALDTTQTVVAPILSAQPAITDLSPTVPLEQFKSLQTEFDKLKDQLAALKAANVSSTNSDETHSATNAAPTPPPPPPAAAPAPPPPPGVNSTPATPYRKSTTTSNTSAFFAQPPNPEDQPSATKEKKPLSLAEEFALRQQSGASLRHVEVKEKPATVLGGSNNLVANALFNKFASLRKLKEEEEAQNGDSSDEDSGFDNN
ncbi:MAG: hypothetical protein K2X50_08025 [Gammaproteobacteria bacterium]|nr:hypothetical protein [Gammaproteobacteria bacterium]